jgi:hypothetical protein
LAAAAAVLAQVGIQMALQRVLVALVARQLYLVREFQLLLLTAAAAVLTTRDPALKLARQQHMALVALVA